MSQTPESGTATTQHRRCHRGWQTDRHRHRIHPLYDDSLSLLHSINAQSRKVVSRGRGTYTAGTLISVPLLKVGWKSVCFPYTFDDLMSPKCTKLHRFAPIFKKNPRGNNPGPPKLGRDYAPSTDFSTLTSAHRPTLSKLPRPLVVRN